MVTTTDPMRANPAMTRKNSKTVKALVSVEGFAAKGELVVGGSTCAVGAASRKMVKVAEVVMVSEDVFSAALKSWCRAMMCPASDPLAPTVASLKADQARMTKGLKLGQKVSMR